MSQTPRLATLGPFEADLVTGELRENGSLVPLQQQPFRLLRALLERPGELVGRDELRRTLWPEGTLVAFERGLTSAMRKVREALGDRAGAARYIETLPGRGYRFIAPAAPTSRKPSTRSDGLRLSRQTTRGFPTGSPGRGRRRGRSVWKKEPART
jgi:DNA-binding winged helix-turn-helix (wHTH) protein